MVKNDEFARCFVNGNISLPHHHALENWRARQVELTMLIEQQQQRLADTGRGHVLDRK